MSVAPNITRLGDGTDLFDLVGANLSGGVNQINTISGAITFTAGTGINISNGANQIVVSSTGVASVGAGNSNVSITGTASAPIVNYVGSGSIGTISVSPAANWIAPPVQIGADLYWISAPFTAPSTGNYIVAMDFVLGASSVTPTAGTAVNIRVVDPAGGVTVLANNVQDYSLLPTMFGAVQSQLYTYCGILPLVAGTLYEGQYVFTNATVGIINTATIGVSVTLVPFV